MPKDKDVPYFQFYPDDFSSDGIVEAMTTEEVGAYILLLCKAWREKPVGSIPNDDRVLARWARLDSDRWTACRSAVLQAFTLRKDGRLYQKRLESEHQKLRSYQAQKSSRAAEAAKARWNQSKGNDLDADALQTHCASNAGAMLDDAIPLPPSLPIPNKDPTDPSITPKPPLFLSQFIELWNQLPNVKICLAASDKRRKAFQARIKAGDKWPWEAALAKFPLRLYRDRKPDEWRPNIDWFLREDTVTRILEGHFDWSPDEDRGGGSRNSRASGYDAIQEFVDAHRDDPQ